MAENDPTRVSSRETWGARVTRGTCCLGNVELAEVSRYILW